MALQRSLSQGSYAAWPNACLQASPTMRCLIQMGLWWTCSAANYPRGTASLQITICPYDGMSCLL